MLPYVSLSPSVLADVMEAFALTVGWMWMIELWGSVSDGMKTGYSEPVTVVNNLGRVTRRHP